MYLKAIEKCKAEGGKFIVEGGVWPEKAMKVAAM